MCVFKKKGAFWSILGHFVWISLGIHIEFPVSVSSWDDWCIHVWLPDGTLKSVTVTMASLFRRRFWKKWSSTWNATARSSPASTSCPTPTWWRWWASPATPRLWCPSLASASPASPVWPSPCRPAWGGSTPLLTSPSTVGSCFFCVCVGGDLLGVVSSSVCGLS